MLDQTPVQIAWVTRDLGSTESAGVPYLEFALIPPEIHAFFDYVKQEQK